MAKAKSQKKASTKAKKTDENDSDIEVIEEMHSEGEDSDASSTAVKGKSRKGRKTTSKGKKTAEKRNSSRRESTKIRKSYKDDDEESNEEDEDAFVPAKKGRKANVELILEDSSSKNTKKESEAEDDKDEEDEPQEKPSKKQTKAKQTKQTTPKKTATKKKAGRPKKADLEDVKEESAEKEEDDEENDTVVADKADKSPKKKGPSGKKATKSKEKKSPKKDKKDEESSEDEDDDTEWEVERIIDVKNHHDGTKDFFIKWKGFPHTQNSWEPESNLGCPEMVAEFMEKLDKDNLSRVRRVSTQNSTRSSISASTMNRVKEGRVSKRSSSRSRTPTIVSSSSNQFSTIIEDEVDGREGEPTIPRQVNGDLTIHKFMKETVQEKLRKIESRSNSVARESDASSSSSSSNVQPKPESKTVNSRRLSRFAKPAKWLAAASAGACGAYYLINTPPSNFNWESIAPALEKLLQQARETFHKMKTST